MERIVESGEDVTFDVSESMRIVREELDVLFARTVDQGTAGAVPFRQVVGPVLRALGAGR